ncbi:hypothetical protein NO2_1381 [Candidatus Termititenax persephonae]|uniref:Uncharacterized protein n=1 Tax=Candidatus Termititenax persephonae TaxID=2218525 RepID=A0A388TJ93_9BACT|nr:hypothetical protein NO2_1381 [Candidatus Termititenax persephonae]
MSIRKTALVIGILVAAAAAAAGALDTNDVNARNNFALGGNPAAIAVNKKVSIEGGTLLTNAVKQSQQNLDATNSQFQGTAEAIGLGTIPDLTKGSDLAPSDFGSATKFLSYTGHWSQSDWYSFRYNNIGNIFYSVGLKTNDDEPGALPTLGGFGAGKKGQLSFTFTEAVESFSAVYGKDLGENLSVGVELAVNTYKVNQDLVGLNKPAYALEQRRGLRSTSYASIALGAIKEFAPRQKISFAHKLSQDRQDSEQTVDHKGNVLAEKNYNESVPNETAISYIYNVDDTLELAVSQRTVWGTQYNRDVEVTKVARLPGGAENTAYNDDGPTKTLPYNTYGLSAAYQPNSEWGFLGYGNYTYGYRAAFNDINLGNHKGFDFTQIGGNIQYSPSLLGGGTLLFGIFNSKIVGLDPAIGFSLDATTSLVSYSHAF